MRNVLFYRNAGFHDHGDWKGNENQVGDDVSDGHGKEMGIALAAPRAWIRNDLPVMINGLARGKIAYDNSYEGYAQEDVNVQEHAMMRTLPDIFSHVPEEEADAVL